MPATGDISELLARHRRLLEQLPVSFAASLRVEVDKWALLFAPERDYWDALLRCFGELEAEAFAELRSVEAQAGLARADGPAQSVQERSQATLRKAGLLPRWRQAVDGVFQRVGDSVDARLHAVGQNRVVIILYGSGIAIPDGGPFARFRDACVPVELGAEPSLGQLLANPGRTPDAGLFAALQARAGFGPLDAWFADANDVLYGLCGGAATGLSYERLRGYREELARALYQKAQLGVSGPQDLAAQARSLDLRAPAGAFSDSDPVVRAFVRDVFLAGNGTLLLNNTFVEWTAVQALRRAQPRLLVARFGVRDKLKPFSSLVLFGPRAAAEPPAAEDPAGSFVDAEQLSYYVWLNAQKSAAYRGRTLYLLWAEGARTLLALRPDGRAGGRVQAPLGSVGSTVAAWLGVKADFALPPLEALLSS